MPQVYLNGDQVEEIREAIRRGVQLDAISQKLGVDPDELARLIGLPSWRSVPQTSNDSRIDLWAGENVL